MSTKFIKALAECRDDLSIELILNTDNVRFFEFANKLLGYISNIKIHKLNLYSNIFPFNSICSLLNTLKVKKNIDDNTIIVCLQGMIELSFLYKIFLKSTNVFSYIPQVLPMKKTKGKFSFIRDFISYKFLYHQFDGIITISQYHKHQLNSFWNVDENKIHIAHNFMQDPYSSKNLLSGRRKRFLICGRIDDNKSQLELVKFFTENDELKKYELDLIGDGDVNLIDEIKCLISNNNNIRLLGWVDNNNIKYDHYDCLIINSKFEGVPLVYIEALSHNLPVISRAHMSYTSDLPNCNIYSDFCSFVRAVNSFSIDFNYRNLFITKYSEYQFKREVDKLCNFLNV